MTYDSWSRGIYNGISKEARDRKRLEEGTDQDNAPFSSNVTFSLFTHSKAGFQIEYPSNWLPEEVDEWSAVFHSPSESSNDKFPGKILVDLSSQDIDRPLPLQHVAGNILADLNKSNILAGTYTKSATIGGYPAIEVHFMIVGNENVEQSRLVGFIGKRAVVIHLKAYDFNRCTPILYRMASSFRRI